MRLVKGVLRPGYLDKGACTDPFSVLGFDILDKLGGSLFSRLWVFGLLFIRKLRSDEASLVKSIMFGTAAIFVIIGVPRIDLNRL